ncbi:MAG: MoxR family ATPase [Haloarculaceae archaeon]
MDVADAMETCDAVLDALAETVVTDREFLETVLLGVVGRGHVLIEDVPGTGKTLTARSLARALGLSFSRIQFTPDLLPGDVTGTHVYDESEGTFEFSTGPIFGNVVLADEINRAAPKTQSALLEAMAEEQVTVGGETFPLPDPFFVVATQNPVEMEGTFELPAAQVDRFLVETAMGYPDLDGEVELLERRRARTERDPQVEPVLAAEDVRSLRAVPETVTVDDALLEYVARITRETRTHRDVEVGVSPRGTQRLFEAARAMAVLAGREYVAPEDVKRVAHPLLDHRVVLTADARVEGTDASTVVEQALETVPVPTV